MTLRLLQFVMVLAWCSPSVHAQAIMSQDLSSQYQAPMHLATLSSPADDYGVRVDVAQRILYVASERSGVAAVYGAGVAAADRIRTALPTVVSGTFNAPGKHRAYVSFSSTGEAVGAAYVMRDARPQVGVISVLREGADLNAGLPIERVNGAFFCSHPTLSANGRRLVMTRDRSADGKGMDIVISERQPGGEWSEPSAISPLINSSGNEITPVLVGNDSLFFASDGYGGRGGMDLFLSVYEDGTWQEPIPLDWLNTEFDETDACMLPDGAIVFASNRPGGLGGTDLYMAVRRVDD